MKFLTTPLKDQLVRNGLKQEPVRGTCDEIDFEPVVKFFTPDAGATWLLTEILPEDEDIAFGLCDLGAGCPELGMVRLSELQCLRGNFGLPVERDRFFKANKTLSGYVREALKAGRIVA